MGEHTELGELEAVVIWETSQGVKWMEYRWVEGVLFGFWGWLEVYDPKESAGHGAD